MTDALVFANGDPGDGPMVQRAINDATSPLVVAADGGARSAQQLGLKVAILVGDMDSLTPEEFDAFSAEAVEIHRHPATKDATDLELALNLLVQRGVTWIRIIGGLGRRLDQTLANVYLLALPGLDGCDVRLVAGSQETYVLRPGMHQINGEAGDTLSLIPLDGDVHGILTENLAYPLYDETLHFGPARGISNTMTKDTACVTFRSGLLLLVHTIGRA